MVACRHAPSCLPVGHLCLSRSSPGVVLDLCSHLWVHRPLVAALDCRVVGRSPSGAVHIRLGLENSHHGIHLNSATPATLGVSNQAVADRRTWLRLPAEVGCRTDLYLVAGTCLLEAFVVQCHSDHTAASQCCWTGCWDLSVDSAGCDRPDLPGQRCPPGSECPASACQTWRTAALPCPRPRFRSSMADYRLSGVWCRRRPSCAVD